MTALLGAYPVQLAAVAIAGVAVHEACHYLTARAVGSPATFAYTWGGLLPAPAVRVDTLTFSPTTYAATVLAPLAVFIPSAVALAALAPTGQPLGLGVMWLCATIPSPPDWRQAYHRGEIAVERAVAEGPHPEHQTAEGIA